MPEPVLCPICKTTAQPLDRVGDADGYRCATHSAFRVARFVFAEERAKQWTREQWEAALHRARGRTEKTTPGEWPLITTYDF
jgi:hypothetical protein